MPSLEHGATTLTKILKSKYLAFTGKDIWNAISKDKHFKGLIQERSNTNQWGIYSLNYYHERKHVHIFQAAPIFIASSRNYFENS